MKILLLYAHPAPQHSKINKRLFAKAGELANLTAVDLYANYPGHDIDVAHEQTALTNHDLVVFQFPLYWYSTPAILKDWQDLVLEHGFAYGEGGIAMRGKPWLCALTTGAPQSDYGPEGRHRFTLRQLLAPLEATANLCGMPFLPPYVMFGALRAEETDRTMHIAGYETLLNAISDDRFDQESALRSDVLTAATIGQFIKG